LQQPELSHVRFYQVWQGQMRRQGRQIPRPRLFLVDNVPDNVPEIGINLLVLLLQLIFNSGNFAPQSLKENRNYFSLLAHFYGLAHRLRCFKPQVRESCTTRRLTSQSNPPLWDIRRNYFQCVRTIIISSFWRRDPLDDCSPNKKFITARRNTTQNKPFFS